MSELEKRQEGTTRTISWVMLITLAGKLLGLFRDRMLAVRYSMGPEASAFFTASRIPRVFFDAVFASAIAGCFIPVFSECMEKKGKREAFAFAGNFLASILLLTGAITALGMVFPQPLVSLFADFEDPGTAALAASLTRILFPTVLFSGLAFSLVGILQAQGRFTAPALMSVASNLVIILYFLFFDSRLGIYGLAAAYLLGWLLQALIQLPSLRSLDFRCRLRLDLRSMEMRKVFSLMAPVMVSTWVQPINLVINARFGSRLYGGGGVAVLEYSTNLYLVIAGVFVLSVTNVIFPKLSRLTAGGQEENFRDTLRRTLRGTLLLVLPMSAGLMAVARPLVSLLYGGGRFDAFSVDVTASALKWLSLGMAGYAVQNILSRACFAKQNGRTPLLAGVVSIGVNLAACAALCGQFRTSGLALASALSSTVCAILLLPRKGERLLDRRAGAELIKMLIASAGMYVCVRFLLDRAGTLLPAGKPGELGALILCVPVGAAVYFGLAWLLGLLKKQSGQDSTKTGGEHG